MLMNQHSPHGPVAITCPASQHTCTYACIRMALFLVTLPSSVSLANSIKCVGNSCSYLSSHVLLLCSQILPGFGFLFMFQRIDSSTHCGCYPVFSMGTMAIMFVCL